MGVRQGIHRHYDLSNYLFAEFLDETMTCSSAWFEDGSEDLATAQRRKIDAIPDLAAVREGTAGWRSAPAGASRRCARRNAAPG